MLGKHSTTEPTPSSPLSFRKVSEWCQLQIATISMAHSRAASMFQALNGFQSQFSCHRNHLWQERGWRRGRGNAEAEQKGLHMSPHPSTQSWQRAKRHTLCLQKAV
jgi:hypothetical protein